LQEYLTTNGLRLHIHLISHPPQGIRALDLALEKKIMETHAPDQRDPEELIGDDVERAGRYESDDDDDGGHTDFEGLEGDDDTDPPEH
jgi:hypothetical protein